MKTIGVLKVRMMLFSSPKFNFEKIGSSDKGRGWLEYREEYLTLEMPSQPKNSKNLYSMCTIDFAHAGDHSILKAVQYNGKSIS